MDLSYIRLVLSFTGCVVDRTVRLRGSIFTLLRYTVNWCLRLFVYDDPHHTTLVRHRDGFVHFSTLGIVSCSRHPLRRTTSKIVEPTDIFPFLGGLVTSRSVSARHFRTTYGP